MQGSLAALPTPAILVFLHSLPLVAALAGLSAWSGVAMSLGPLTVSTLLGAAPTAIISGVQVHNPSPSPSPSPSPGPEPNPTP